MKLIQNKKYFSCRKKGQNYNDCIKRQAIQRIVTVAQALSIRRESRPKGFNKDKTKKQPQFKATELERTDFSKVLEKANKYSALVLVDLQTQGGDLIDSKFFTSIVYQLD